MSYVIRNENWVRQALSTFIQNNELTNELIKVYRRQLEVLQPKYKKLISLIKTVQVFSSSTSGVSPSLLQRLLNTKDSLTKWMDVLDSSLSELDRLKKGFRVSIDYIESMLSDAKEYGDQIYIDDKAMIDLMENLKNNSKRLIDPPNQEQYNQELYNKEFLAALSAVNNIIDETNVEMKKADAARKGPSELEAGGSNEIGKSVQKTKQDDEKLLNEYERQWKKYIALRNKGTPLQPTTTPAEAMKKEQPAASIVSAAASKPLTFSPSVSQEKLQTNKVDAKSHAAEIAKEKKDIEISLGINTRKVYEKSPKTLAQSLGAYTDTRDKQLQNIEAVKKYLLAAKNLEPIEKAHLLHFALNKIYQELLGEHKASRWTFSKSRLEKAIETEMATLKNNFITLRHVPPLRKINTEIIQSILDGNNQRPLPKSKT